MIHGDDILQRIENTPTLHESPVLPIIIEECGVFTMEDKPSPYFMKNYHNYKERIENIKKKMSIEENTHKPEFYPIDIADPRDLTSDMTLTKYKKGYYFR